MSAGNGREDGPRGRGPSSRFHVYRRECGCVLDIDWNVHGQIVDAIPTTTCPTRHMRAGGASLDALETLRRAGWPVYADLIDPHRVPGETFERASG